MWISATYPSLQPGSPSSEAIIWDQIIPSDGQLDPFNPITYIQSLTSKAKPKSKSKSKSSTKVTNNKKPGLLHYKNLKPKYQITDISGKLAERRNVTLELGWNVQPWVGALTWTMPQGSQFGRWSGIQGGRSKAFDMPALKGKKPEVVSSDGVPKPAEASPVI